MAEIRIEGKVAAGFGDHLYLVFVDDSGAEFVIRGGPASDTAPGFSPIETESGVPIGKSEDSRPIEDRADFGSRVIDLGGRDANDVWETMKRVANLIEAAHIDYDTFGPNSNSTVASILHAVGIDANAILPNVPGINFFPGVSYNLLDDYARVFTKDHTSSNRDILRGGSLADRFESGGGADWLVGGRGGDQLKGGEGRDTYVFMPGDGHDVITDSDGLGEIRIDGTTLTGSTEAAYRKDGATVWKSTDGRHLYTLSNGDPINGGRLTITGTALAADDEIVIEDFHNGDLDIELNPEHRIALLTGVEANPFNADGYTPESAPVAMRERGAQTFTIALNRPARADERVRLQLGGGAAGAFVVVTGDQTLAFTGGLVELALTAGQDVVTVSIQHQADVDAIETLSLSASLVDTSGSQAVAERSIELLGEPEAEAPSQFSHTIEGDLRWQDFDASEPGIQVRYDALGNIITDGTLNPGQVDDLNDSPGNDQIYAGGGDDTVEALRGGDDLIDGGDGSDYLYGGAGEDTYVFLPGDRRDVITGSDRLGRVRVDERFLYRRAS